MKICLSRDRILWQIPGTDLALSRAEPAVMISSDELASLSDSQKKILEDGLRAGYIKVVPDDFEVREPTPNDLLNLSLRDLQKKHISRFVQHKNLGLLKTLQQGEISGRNRPQVNQMLEFAIQRLLEENPEEQFLSQIETIEVVHEAPRTVASEESKAPKKKRRVAREVEQTV